MSISTAELSAIASLIQGGAVSLAVAVAIWQIFELRRTRRDEARAYLLVNIEVHTDRYTIPDVVLRNFGRTVAYDISVKYDPPIRTSLYDAEKVDLSQTYFQAGVPMLAPGQAMRTIFDSMIDRPEEWEDEYGVTVSYDDVYGTRHSSRSVVSVGAYRQLESITRHGVHELHGQLKKLTAEVKHMRTGFGQPMPIELRSRRSRRRQEWAHIYFRKADFRGAAPDVAIWVLRSWEWTRDEAHAVRRWLTHRLSTTSTRDQ